MDQGWVKDQQSECSDLFRAVPGVVYLETLVLLRGPGTSDLSDGL